MAKRFGRNQRRKLREENAQLMNTCMDMARDRAAFEKLANEWRDRINHWASEVRYLLGENSAFNETLKRVRVDNVNALGGRLRLPKEEPLSIATPSATLKALSVEENFSVIESFVMTARVQSDRFKPIITVIVEDRDGNTVALAVDRQRLTNWSPRVIRQNADSIAFQMAQFYDAERRRR